MIPFVALLGVLGAEGLAMYAVGELIAAGYGSGSPGAVGWWGFVLVALAGYGLPRVAEAAGLIERRATAAIAIVGLGLIFVIVRVTYGDAPVWDFRWLSGFISDTGSGSKAGGQAIIGACLLATIWLRSVNRSADGIDLQLVPKDLGVPLIAVTGIIVLGAMFGRGGEVGRAGAAFYAVAVVALACSQLARSGVSLEDKEAGEIVGALLGGTAIAVLASLVVVTIGLGLLGPLIGPPLAAAVNETLTIVLTPFAWAMEKLFRALAGNHTQWPKIDPASLKPGGDLKPGQESNRNPVENGGLILFRALLIVAICAAAYMVFRWVTRLRNRIREEAAAVDGSVPSGTLREDLGGIFRGLFRRGGGSSRSSGPETRVGRLYRDVLERSERAGRPRSPSRTPTEFAPELRQALQAPVTDEITRAFEHARYAGREPSAAEIDDLERRWRVVR